MVINATILINIITILFSGIALIISYFSYRESKKNRIEFGRAFLSVELFQEKESLYIFLSNIGNTYAYDINVKISEGFVNGFENLCIIRPGNTYRCLLLNTQNISNYPEKIKIIITYHDYYSPKRIIKKEFQFEIINSSKFDISYNKNFACYDITKSF